MKIASTPSILDHKHPFFCWLDQSDSPTNTNSSLNLIPSQHPDLDPDWPQSCNCFNYPHLQLVLYSSHTYELHRSFNLTSALLDPFLSIFETSWGCHQIFPPVLVNYIKIHVPSSEIVFWETTRVLRPYLAKSKQASYIKEASIRLIFSPITVSAPFK